MSRREYLTWIGFEFVARVGAVVAFGFTFLHPSKHPGVPQYAIAIAAFGLLEFVLGQESRRRHVKYCEKCQKEGYHRH